MKQPPPNIPLLEAERECWVYARVSTSGQNARQQFRAVRLEAHRRRWRIVRVFYERLSTRGFRPQYQLLRRQARRARRGTGILVYSLSRWERDGPAQTLSSIHELDAGGLVFASVVETWADTVGPERDLLLSIFGWLARQERDRISRDTRRGQAEARRRGRRVGRPSNANKRLAESVAAGGLDEEAAASEAGVRVSTMRRWVAELGRKNGVRK